MEIQEQSRNWDCECVAILRLVGILPSRSKLDRLFGRRKKLQRRLKAIFIILALRRAKIQV
jgi:hypothetical protein